ncbi:12900_t:CDS:2, partial [Acaulospora morrowiae]
NDISNKRNEETKTVKEAKVGGDRKSQLNEHQIKEIRNAE